MPFYHYEVVNQSGEFVRGNLEAKSEEAVLERLHKQGLAVTEINSGESSLSRAFTFGLRKKVKTGDLAVFCRQLASMLQAGIPLARSLFILGREVNNPTLRSAVSDAVQNVEGGMSFSDTLRRHPDVFPEMFVNMVSSGEMGGSLEQVLQRLAEQLERDRSLQANIRSATMYPVVVLSFALVVLLAMMIFIVPLIMSYFPSGFTLPLMTRMVVAFSNSIRHYWYIWIMAIVLVILLVRSYTHSAAGARVWDRMKMRLPAFGPLIQKVVMARFARTLETLLASGIPIVQALDAAGGASGSYLVAEAAHRAGEKIQEGKSIAAPLEESGVFTPMLIHMISIGEESGNLPFLLGNMAEYYEVEVATSTKALASMIEPLLIIFVGALVAFTVISLYLPMFLVETHVGQ